jgi:hypothetical protein
MIALRNQYARYLQILEKQGDEDEIGFVGFINMVLQIGLGVQAGILIRKENELGLDQGDLDG